MKKILLIVGIVSIGLYSSCEKEGTILPKPTKCSIKGRWETKFNVLYEFTDSFRYTFYKDPTKNEYGTLSEGLGLDKKRWYMKGDSLVIDHDGRGNSLSVTLPKFSCDCNVTTTNHEYNGSEWKNIQWKEGHDTLICK